MIFSNFVHNILIRGLTEIMENDEFSIPFIGKKITFWLVCLFATIVCDSQVILHQYFQ